MAGHDRDRHRKLRPCGACQHRHEWAWPLGAGSRGEDEKGNILILLDHLDDLVAFHPGSDDLLGIAAGCCASTLGSRRQEPTRLLLGLCLHGVADTEWRLEVHSRYYA